MTNYLIIKVNNHVNRFLRKMMEHNISIFNVNYIDEDNILVKVLLEDFSRIKKLNYYSKIKIVKYDGIEGIKRHFRNNIYVYIIVFLCFVLMDVITSYIIRIDIIHENSSLRKLVAEELEELDIKKYTLALGFAEIEEIKNKILDDNPLKIEWLSITRKGMTYVVRIEERIITEIKPETGFQHIISTKDALITKIINSRGDSLVRSGDYVRKGDILISGEIKLYEEVKGNVYAKGEVYGDVWYTVDISIPLNVTEKEITDNKRFNMMINNKALFKNKYQYFDQLKMKKISILGINFSFYQEKEYKLINKKYTQKEAETLALERIEKEFRIKLNGKGSIKEKKVLKKEEINSTISMRVFVITNELISEAMPFDIGSEINDSSSSS